MNSHGIDSARFLFSEPFAILRSRVDVQALMGEVEGEVHVCIRNRVNFRRVTLYHIRQAQRACFFFSNSIVWVTYCILPRVERDVTAAAIRSFHVHSRIADHILLMPDPLNAALIIVFRLVTLNTAL